MINTNLPAILHRFRDIAVDRSKIAIFYYPSCVQLPRRRGCPGPWDDLRKIFVECQRMAKVPNAAEILPKISTAWVGCTSVTDRQTDDRQTDGRQHIANVNVSSRSLIRLPERIIQSIKLAIWLKHRNRNRKKLIPAQSLINCDHAQRRFISVHSSGNILLEESFVNSLLLKEK